MYQSNAQESVTQYVTVGGRAGRSKMFKFICFRTYFVPTPNIVLDSNDITVVTDNLSHQRHHMCASSVHLRKPSIPITHAVADTGATPVMVMKNTLMKNIHPTTNPLHINLPDGTIVKSTHLCDLEIP